MNHKQNPETKKSESKPNQTDKLDQKSKSNKHIDKQTTLDGPNKQINILTKEYLTRCSQNIVSKLGIKKILFIGLMGH